jgi:hypothetical protein
LFTILNPMMIAITHTKKTKRMIAAMASLSCMIYQCYDSVFPESGVESATFDVLLCEAVK